MDCVVNHPQPGDPSYDLWIKVNIESRVFIKKYLKLCPLKLGSIISSTDLLYVGENSCVGLA